MVQKKLKPVRSLKELMELVMIDPRYETIVIGAARDLGGRPSAWHDAINFLGACAAETSEGKVMQAVNHNIASRRSRPADHNKKLQNEI
jgi:hypothetical protein